MLPRSGRNRQARTDVARRVQVGTERLLFTRPKACLLCIGAAGRQHCNACQREIEGVRVREIGLGYADWCEVQAEALVKQWDLKEEKMLQKRKEEWIAMRKARKKNVIESRKQSAKHNVPDGVQDSKGLLLPMRHVDGPGVPSEIKLFFATKFQRFKRQQWYNDVQQWFEVENQHHTEWLNMCKQAHARSIVNGTAYEDEVKNMALERKEIRKPRFHLLANAKELEVLMMLGVQQAVHRRDLIIAGEFGHVVEKDDQDLFSKLREQLGKLSGAYGEAC